MIVPIRELVNIYIFTLATISQPSTMARIPSNIDIDIDIDIIRRRSNSSSKVSSRELLTYSDTSSTPYHKIIEIQNNSLDKNI